MPRSGRAAALGQAAHPHRRRPAARLPGVRRVRRPARPPRPGAPVRATPTWNGCWDDQCASPTCRRPPCSSTPTRWRPTSPTWPPPCPAPRLRPHVKAHKTTALARQQAAAGHTGFTCATVREVEGMAAAGLGEDLLLANEVLDARRLGALVEAARGHGRGRLAGDARRGRARAGCGRCSSTSTSGCRAAGSPRSGPGGSPTRPARPGSGARRDGLRGPPHDAARRRRAGPAHRGVHGEAARRARRRRRRGRVRRRHRHLRHEHLGHRDPGRARTR